MLHSLWPQGVCTLAWALTLLSPLFRVWLVQGLTASDRLPSETEEMGPKNGRVMVLLLAGPQFLHLKAPPSLTFAPNPHTCGAKAPAHRQHPSRN